LHHPPRPTLCPYTTLFRSEGTDECADHGDMRLLETVVRLAQQLVHRAQLLVALPHLGGLRHVETERVPRHAERHGEDKHTEEPEDRKSTRLNSSHQIISYA